MCFKIWIWMAALWAFPWMDDTIHFHFGGCYSIRVHGWLNLHADSRLAHTWKRIFNFRLKKRTHAFFKNEHLNPLIVFLFCPFIILQFKNFIKNSYKKYEKFWSYGGCNFENSGVKKPDAYSWGNGYSP